MRDGWCPKCSGSIVKVKTGWYCPSCGAAKMGEGKNLTGMTRNERRLLGEIDRLRAELEAAHDCPVARMDWIPCPDCAGGEGGE